MFRRNLVPVWIGIFLLSGMFLLGQDSWPPATFRIVFVSPVQYEANFGGLAVADALCQAEADAAGLTGTFLAWLSDSAESPSTRFNKNGGPFLLVDGTIIADDWEGLLSIDHPINMTATGGSYQGWVWTGTYADGTQADGSHCNSWTSLQNMYFGVGADTYFGGEFWSYSMFGRCDLEDWTGGFYCFQQ